MLKELPLLNKLPSSLRFNKRYTAPLLITIILLGAHFSFGILESYNKLGASILGSFFMELLLGRIVLGKWRNLASAYISGISIGILFRSPYIWPYALGSMISIATKYVLRYKGTHIWNPSNFGVVAMLLLTPSVSILSIQWGNYIWPNIVVWIVGFIIVWRVNRLHITVTYILSFLFFSVLRSGITGAPVLAEIAPITGPMYQLFCFFMITDPKTTVKSRRGQYLFAFTIAFVEFFFRLNDAIYAPFYALFIVGPIAMLIEMWYKRKDEKAE